MLSDKALSKTILRWDWARSEWVHSPSDGMRQFLYWVNLVMSVDPRSYRRG